MARFQKTIEFSDALTKRLIEERLKDLYYTEHTGQSAIIEEAILGYLLPKNKEVRDIVRRNLYGKDFEKCGVKNSLYKLFQLNVPGDDRHPRYSNYKPLLEYCLKYVSRTSVSKSNEGNICYLADRFSSIIALIEEAIPQCEYEDDKVYYQMQLTFANRLHDIATQNPSKIDVRAHFELAYDCWNILNEYSVTYRYLMAITELGKFEESEISRNELFNLMTSMSDNWKDEL